MHVPAPSLSLDQLRPGQQARILHLEGEAMWTFRLMELGLQEGEEVEYLGKAPLGDPIAIRIRGARLALRRCDAARVQVEHIGPNGSPGQNGSRNGSEHGSGNGSPGKNGS